MAMMEAVSDKALTAVSEPAITAVSRNSAMAPGQSPSRQCAFKVRFTGRGQSASALSSASFVR